MGQNLVRPCLQYPVFKNVYQEYFKFSLKLVTLRNVDRNKIFHRLTVCLSDDEHDNYKTKKDSIKLF